MNSINDIAKTGTASHAKAGEAFKQSNELLPIESVAKRKLREVSGKSQDDVKLGRLFNRLDVSFLSGSLKKQAGIPVLVPKFAMQDINESELSLEVWVDIEDQTSNLVDDRNNSYSGYARNPKTFLARSNYLDRRDHWWIAALCLIATVGAGSTAWWMYAAYPNAWWIPAAVGVGTLIATIINGSTTLFPSLSGGKRSFNMKCAFAGVIPETVKKTISKHKAKFEAVFMIYEVQEWAYAEKRFQRQVREFFLSDPDPLIVGRKDGVYYIISKFDTTPAEEWVRAEFGE